MTMSDRERRLLAETARSIEEQDPGLAAALRGWFEPAAEHVVRRRRTVSRWCGRFRNVERAPLRTAIAGGALFVAGLLFTAHIATAPAPVPGATAPVAADTVPFTPL
ncbi:MAG TPA: DUF3040 domain-containing protein [Sporichthya sp.]|nr:DUF3040 domain-containing protein [Sporichthya sp.]